jgi:phage tail P2-like protein
VTKSLLPPNSTLLERAIEAAMHKRLNALPVPIRDLWNADTCPAHLLGWLAWAKSVDVWDESWPEAQKRAVIKASRFVHQHKGTIGAVRRALDALGIGLEIREWFETGDAPGTFRVDAFADYIFASGFGLNPALLGMIDAQIRTVKRASQHFTLRVGENFTARQPVRTGVRSQSVHSGNVRPEPRGFTGASLAYLRTAQRDARIHRHTHNLTLRTA